MNMALAGRPTKTASMHHDNQEHTTLKHYAAMTVIIKHMLAMIAELCAAWGGTQAG